MSDANYDEYRRSRMSNDERQGIMTLDMLGRSFDEAAEKLAGRLKSYKYLKRDLGAIRGALLRIRTAALDGVQKDIEETILRQSWDYTLTIARVSPIKPSGNIVMPMEHEWQLISLALDERCGVCLKTDAEARKCELRKLLRHYLNEPEPELSACGYMGRELNDKVKNMNKQKLEI